MASLPSSSDPGRFALARPLSLSLPLINRDSFSTKSILGAGQKLYSKEG